MKKDTLYNLIGLVLIAWAGWASLLLTSVDKRLGEVETRLGLHAKFAHPTVQYAYPQLWHVPDLTPAPIKEIPK